MTRSFRITCLLAVPALTLAAATASGAPEPAGLAALVAAHREASTIAPAFATMHLPGSPLRADSASYSIEAVIAPSFALWRGRAPGLPGAFQLDATPRFAVRRSDGMPSNPVYTPDYRPHVDLYYAPGDTASRWGAAFTLEHHSNGQAGPFLREDGGGPNVVDGSFSLWNVAAALHMRFPQVVPGARAVLQARYHYKKENELDALYPDWILSFGLRAAPTATPREGRYAGRTSYALDLDWLPRTRSARPRAWKPAPFGAALMIVHAPAWRHGSGTGDPTPLLGDAALFARFQAGPDPYNMNFARTLRRLEAGLSIPLGL